MGFDHIHYAKYNRKRHKTSTSFASRNRVMNAYNYEVPTAGRGLSVKKMTNCKPEPKNQLLPFKKQHVLTTKKHFKILKDYIV